MTRQIIAAVVMLVCSAFGLGLASRMAPTPPPRHHFSEPVQPNCTTDRLDYSAGQMPRYHVGLYPKQEWWDGVCPDWRRRHTWGMA